MRREIQRQGHLRIYVSSSDLLLFLLGGIVTYHCRYATRRQAPFSINQLDHGLSCHFFSLLSLLEPKGWVGFEGWADVRRQASSDDLCTSENRTKEPAAPKMSRLTIQFGKDLKGTGGQKRCIHSFVQKRKKNGSHCAVCLYAWY